MRNPQTSQRSQLQIQREKLNTTHESIVRHEGQRCRIRKKRLRKMLRLRMTSSKFKRASLLRRENPSV